MVTGALSNLVLVIAIIWKYFQTEPFGKEKQNHRECWLSTQLQNISNLKNRTVLIMFGKISSFFFFLHGAKILVGFEYVVSAEQLLKTVVKLKPKQKVESNTRFFHILCLSSLISFFWPDKGFEQFSLLQ